MKASKVKGSRASGFTLIELMIVVAIIGILAAIAIPKFANLIRKSGEGASKGNVGSIRSALSIYYGDMEGQYPSNLASARLYIPRATTLFQLGGLKDAGRFPGTTAT